MDKNKLAITIWITLISLCSACNVEPKQINYGEDHCSYCDMTVVDRSHSAQYVTKKGKPFVFDAIECMVMKLAVENNENLMAFILVSDFNNPGTLIDAKTATYLISKNIQSPMGANLSAFYSPEMAKNIMTEAGGELYTWEQLKVELSK